MGETNRASVELGEKGSPTEEPQVDAGADPANDLIPIRAAIDLIGLHLYGERWQGRRSIDREADKAARELLTHLIKTKRISVLLDHGDRFKRLTTLQALHPSFAIISMEGLNVGHEQFRGSIRKNELLEALSSVPASVSDIEQCRAWLRHVFKGPPKHLRIKDDFASEAASRFDIGYKRFCKQVWSVVTKEPGNERWARGGFRPENPPPNPTPGAD